MTPLTLNVTVKLGELGEAKSAVIEEGTFGWDLTEFDSLCGFTKKDTKRQMFNHPSSRATYFNLVLDDNDGAVHGNLASLMYLIEERTKVLHYIDCKVGAGSREDAYDFH